MASQRKILTTSDRTGQEIRDETNIVSITVRNHPALPKGTVKVIDIDFSELDHLKAFHDNVQIEVELPNQKPIALSCNVAELAKFIPDEKILRADTLRRRNNIIDAVRDGI